MSWQLVRAGGASVRMAVPKIVGKQRPRRTFSNGIPRTYTPKATKQAERIIRDAWMRQVGDRWAGFDGEVWLAVEFTRELAKSNPLYWLGRGDTGKPDLDNACKTVLDALNGLAWRDDAQITRCECIKMPRTANGTGCLIEIHATYYREIHTKE